MGKTCKTLSILEAVEAVEATGSRKRSETPRGDEMKTKSGEWARRAGQAGAPPRGTTRARRYAEYLISLWMFASGSCRQTLRIVQFICIEKKGKEGRKKETFFPFKSGFHILHKNGAAHSYLTPESLKNPLLRRSDD